MNKFNDLFNTIMEEVKSSKKHIIKESRDWDNWPSFVDPSLVQKKQDKYGRNYTAWKEGLTLRELLDAPGGEKNVQAFAIWCLQHDYYDGDNVEPDEIVDQLKSAAMDEEARNPDLDELKDILQQAEDDYLDEAGKNMWNAIQNNKEAFKKIVEANKDNELALAKVLRFAQQEFYPDNTEDECKLSDDLFWIECGCDIPEGVELIQTCEGSWGWDNWYDRENCYGPMVEKIIEELGIGTDPIQKLQNYLDSLLCILTQHIFGEEWWKTWNKKSDNPLIDKINQAIQGKEEHQIFNKQLSDLNWLNSMGLPAQQIKQQFEEESGVDWKNAMDLIGEGWTDECDNGVFRFKCNLKSKSITYSGYID